MTSTLEHYIDRFSRGRSVEPSEGEGLLDAMIGETDEALLATLFRSWNEKGIEEDEIFAIANVLRKRCTRVVTKHETFVDIVGTGGSTAKTFNVSTAAAFVVAGAGVPVAKHGNRAATSNSGSADVLAELGVEPAVDAVTAGRCLDEIGICFMFAPNFHRLSPTLAKVRRGLGFPTIFNCVGPLCNPAGAPHQLIGVWSDDMVPKMASALARLGTTKSWVVHGKDGLDEISPFCETTVAEIENDVVNVFRIPSVIDGAGLANRSEIMTGSVADSASMIRRVLSAEHSDRTSETIVCLNAGAALVLAGAAKDIEDGCVEARGSIRSGAARRKLGELAKIANGQ